MIPMTHPLQHDFLSDAGCDNYHSYFFSRPLSTEDF